MSNHPASAYQQLAASGASPVGLVISLYDTILRDFRRAQAAMQAGNVEQRVFEMNHSLTVIAHLQSVLNHERGGEAAKSFDRFYEITRPMILSASVHCTPESLQKLIAMYTSLRQAWQQIEPQAAGAQLQPTPAPARPASTSTATVSEPAPSRTGNWSA